MSVQLAYRLRLEQDIEALNAQIVDVNVSKPRAISPSFTGFPKYYFASFFLLPFALLCEVLFLGCIDIVAKKTAKISATRACCQTLPKFQTAKPHLI